MELNLKRPIIFFDLETTGIDIARDRIVEISMVKVMPDGEEIVRTRRINPGMPIPAEATAIHGITDEDVKVAHFFRKLPSRWPSLSRMRLRRFQFEPLRSADAGRGVHAGRCGRGFPQT